MIFASRYGDLSATAELLEQLHLEDAVSPMGFSLAVHNAAVGVYSIARQDRTSSVSIAAGVDLAELACFEALGWIASGARRVVIVCCGEAVPVPYLPEGGRQESRHAWACQLRETTEGGFSLSAIPEGWPAMPEPEPTPVESSGLRALAFLVGGQEGVMASESGRYLWQRHV